MSPEPTPETESPTPMGRLEIATLVAMLLLSALYARLPLLSFASAPSRIGLYCTSLLASAWININAM